MMDWVRLSRHPLSAVWECSISGVCVCVRGRVGVRLRFGEGSGLLGPCLGWSVDETRELK